MPWNTASSRRGATVGRQVKTSTLPPPSSTEWTPSPGAIVAVISKPYVHRQAVAIPFVGRAKTGRLARGDQRRRAADRDGVEDVVARRTGQALDFGLEAMPGEKLAPLRVAFGLALLAEHRLAVHAREGELGMGLVDD